MSYQHEVVVVIPAHNEEKSLARTLSALYKQEDVKRFPTILIDNASKDDTRAVAERFKRNNPDFDLTILDENRKGTGYAVATGFDHAINKIGTRLVARTDADAQPSSKWLSRGIKHLPVNATKQQAVTGPVLASRDEFYKRRDDLIWPAFIIGAATVYMVLHRNPAAFKYMAGENTLIRSVAYEAVGGYPEGAIEEQCEDVALTQALVDKYGQQAIGWDMQVRVRSSMRRVRSIGYSGIMQCYIFHPNDKQVRLAVNKGNIDHR